MRLDGKTIKQIQNAEYIIQNKKTIFFVGAHIMRLFLMVISRHSREILDMRKNTSSYYSSKYIQKNPARTAVEYFSVTFSMMNTYQTRILGLVAHTKHPKQLADYHMLPDSQGKMYP